MHSNHCLQRVQRILRRILLVVDVGLGDDVVRLVAADEVDVLLAIVVDRCFQTQLLVNGLFEGIS